MSVLEPLSDHFNFATHALEANAPHPDAMAFVDDVQEMTYGRLSDSVRRFGNSLTEMGLRREERILILMTDSVEWPVAFLGAMYAGLIPVPVNTLLPETDLAYILDHSGVVAAVVNYHLIDLIQKAHGRSEDKSCRMLIVAGTGELPSGSVAFDAAVRSGGASFAGARTHRDSIGFWLYSSGSTGRPKGVTHTHANLFWTAELYAKPILGLQASDRVFSAAKLFFAYGLGNSLTFPLSVGASAVLMAERPTPAAVLERVRRHRPSIFCGAPTLYASLLSMPHEGEKTATSLRVCTSAGEALPREVGVKFTDRFGVHILDGLGSTEMLHIYISNRPGDVAYGTTGKVVEGYQVELRDEAGAPVLDEVVGDLWVKGPSAALLYWNDRVRTGQTFHGQWLKSGDKYSRRPDGCYIYAGRNDDMLKVSGQYVSPFEVESTLMQHPSVLESGVVAVHDESGICKCKAFVVLKNATAGTTELGEELKAFVKGRLAPFKRPHFVEFVLDLPKTSTGKIQRFRLRELAAKNDR